MLDALNNVLWGYAPICGLIAAGLAFTVASRFVQFRCFGTMFGILGQAFHHEAGHLTSFEALMLSVAGPVGARHRGLRCSKWGAAARLAHGPPTQR